MVKAKNKPAKKLSKDVSVGFLVDIDSLVAFKKQKEEVFDKIISSTATTFETMFHTLNNGHPYWTFATIRPNGRVGTTHYLSLKKIGSIMLLEPFSPQKRWYKALIHQQEKINTPHKMKTLYFYADPWVFIRLLEKQDLAEIANLKAKLARFNDMESE